MGKQSARNAGTNLGAALAVLAVNGSDVDTITRAVQSTVRSVPKDQHDLAFEAALIELSTKFGQAIASVDAVAPGFREAFRNGMNRGLTGQMDDPGEPA